MSRHSCIVIAASAILVLIAQPIWAAGEPAPGPIQETRSPLGWRIETAGSVYQIAVADDGIPVPIYYGPKAQPAPAQHPPLKVNPKVGSTIREIPFRGGFVDQTPAIEVVFADRTRDCQLVYDSAQIAPVDGQPCLTINLKERPSGLRVLPRPARQRRHREVAGPAEFQRSPDHRRKCAILVHLDPGRRI